MFPEDVDFDGDPKRADAKRKALAEFSARERDGGNERSPSAHRLGLLINEAIRHQCLPRRKRRPLKPRARGCRSLATRPARSILLRCRCRCAMSWGRPRTCRCRTHPKRYLGKGCALSMICPAALPRGSVWTLQSWVEAKAGEAAMGKGLIEGVGTFGGDQVKPLAAAPCGRLLD